MADDYLSRLTDDEKTALVALLRDTAKQRRGEKARRWHAPTEA